MTTIDLFLFLTSYTLTVAAAAVSEFLRSRDSKFLITVAVSLAIIPVNTIVGTYLDPNASLWDTLGNLIKQRDTSSVAAVLMGVAAGFVWWTRHTTGGNHSSRSIGSWLEPALLAGSIGLVVICGQAYLWKEIGGVTRHSVSVHDSQFVIEKIADFDYQPLRLAADDDGQIYVCHDYFMKHGAFGGAIVRLWQDGESGKFKQKIVTESPFLARCYGLALRDSDLYVSRSGFFARTYLGRVSHENTGAVTQLKDLNGDGYFEYAHDVISGLPGTRAPDTPQQNNGIVFGADGSLFVSNAVAADRSLDEHPWGGTILKFSPDFTQSQVFAKGFRNSWTITIGPDDELFATDTDVDKNPGDEINHVVEGGHYGHPFVIPNESGVEAIGFREPLMVGERETVFTGMAYTASPALPEEYRNCLYVSDFRQNRILRIKLERRGDSYQVVGVYPFARVPSPVDLVFTPAGELYVASRRAQKLYRIRLNLVAK